MGGLPQWWPCARGPFWRRRYLGGGTRGAPPTQAAARGMWPPPLARFRPDGGAIEVVSTMAVPRQAAAAHVDPVEGGHDEWIRGG